MPQPKVLSLWDALRGPGDPRSRWIRDQSSSVALCDLETGSCLGGAADLVDRSVLIAARDQLETALALIELDGVARRMVLCTPDFPLEHLPTVAATAEVDAVVSDRADLPRGIGAPIVPSTQVEPRVFTRGDTRATEWILFTSGTTGVPKMVVHTLATLAGAIRPGSELAKPAVWCTFYDIRRFGGLQIFLRAVLGGGSLLLSSAEEPVADLLLRMRAAGVSHITGTPSHWRRALMNPASREIEPEYARLSGEIADQPILDALRACYPRAKIGHAFASTEAGVAFEVNDGFAGFPASLVSRPNGEVQMKIEDGSLRIRSPRAALRYLGEQPEPLLDADGYVDTGDMLELHGDRYVFVGRRGGIINVGGLKIHPEEVEAVINCHPRVRFSLVRARKSPITGAVVVADVVLAAGSPRDDAAGSGSGGAAAGGQETLKREILATCRSTLAAHKVPAMIRIVPSLPLTPAGKVARSGA
jgi:acyl-coenzyme A synthetase/AMP-(fatty) acid ligase